MIFTKQELDAWLRVESYRIGAQTHAALENNAPNSVISDAIKHKIDNELWHQAMINGINPETWEFDPPKFDLTSLKNWK